VFVPVETAEEMREAVLQHSRSATIVIKGRGGRLSREGARRRQDQGKRDLTWT
jgi:hypothetical protein